MKKTRVYMKLYIPIVMVTFGAMVAGKLFFGFSNGVFLFGCLIMGVLGGIAYLDLKWRHGIIHRLYR